VKVLLDENLDHRLRTHLAGHEVFTVRYQGWDGLKNGRLLRAAEDAAFDVLVTGDQSLRHEQKVSTLRLAVMALSTVEWRIFKDFLPQIASAIDSASPGSFQVVQCGQFRRKKIGGS
jgi:hypothetical protein